MKKTINRLPDSELDIMLVLWKYEPPMTRIEIERVVNEKKSFSANNHTFTSYQTGEKEFCESDKTGKNESLHAADFPGGISAE